ncbi:MAG: hypothetical protein JKY52_17890, partial [Flavobacteriales bacterium]|nr:hypothetical protein [Flavobacteriales bacterium]
MVHLIDSRAGLQNDMLWGAWEDDQGNLWLGSNNGISRLEYNSPMSTFNEESNFGERVNKILRYNNRIYLATETGVYHYSKADQSILLDNKFTDYNSTVQDVNTLIWDMCEFEGKLLAVSSRGVYMIRGDDVSLISKIRARSISKVACKDSSSVLIGNNLGQVFYLKFDQNDLVSTHLIEDSLGQIMDIKGVYTKNGELNIWAGTFEHTVVRVRVDSVGRDYKVEVYDTSAGLSPGQIIVHMLKDEIVFGGDKGLYRFNNVQSRFELDPSFVVNYPDTAQKQVFKLYEDRSGKVWVSDGTYLICGNDVNGKYEWTGIPFYGMDIGHINSVYD